MSINSLDKLTRTARRVYIGVAEYRDALLARVASRASSEEATNQRITIVQFGDYADAYWRFAGGGSENYYAQKYSVEYVSSLAAAKQVESLTVFSLSADLADVVLPNGVRTGGLQLYPSGGLPRYRQLLDAVKRTRPTHLIVCSPCVSLIAWAVRSGVPVLPLFADSFRSHELKASVDHRFLALVLNSSRISLVSNHNLAASLDLKRIGVNPDKVIPFDWPPVISPRSYAVKRAVPINQTFRLVFVGSLIETKGLGDAIQAVSILRKRGAPVELTVIGRGEPKSFEELAATANVDKHVFFLGPKSHADVIAAMRDHDAVLVPSHWSYPEGLPMTLYEALCTRTPLLASDHPMFRLKIHNLGNALVFAERNPEAMANCIDKLRSSAGLYERLSAAGATAADDYLCPLKYDQLISGFLNSAEREKLRRYALSNLKIFGA